MYFSFQWSTLAENNRGCCIDEKILSSQTKEKAE